MLVHLLNLETERRDSQETGTGATPEEFAKVKKRLIFAGFYSETVDDGMIEQAVWAEPAFGDPGARRFKPPYLDTQAFCRTSACNIDRMSGYPASHFVSCPLNAGV
jgi:hypothetical protein